MLEALLADPAEGRVSAHLVQGADPGCATARCSASSTSCSRATTARLRSRSTTIPARRRAAADDGASEPEGDGTSLEVPVFAAVVNALQSPPFMTAHRVVVVREIGNLTTDQAKWIAAWMDDPLDATRLVLVAGGGRTPPALDKAGKAHGSRSRRRRSRPPTCSPPRSRTPACGSRRTRRRTCSRTSATTRAACPSSSRCSPRPTATARRSTSTTSRSYLGDVGTAGPFDLTNAIDRGDVASALEVLHRLLTATSAAQPKPLHPMQVMASLVRHYQRLLRLDDPASPRRNRPPRRSG